MNNKQRAKAGRATLLWFTVNHGERGEGLQRQNLVDLLADLAHYCDAVGAGFSGLPYLGGGSLLRGNGGSY